MTPETMDDVGSPNRILREEIGGKVIVRTGRRIPGVVPFGGVHAPISVVRMAVGDAYGAKEWREGSGDDEVAYRTERIERSVCRAVAEFSFREAERTGAKVFGGPKYTVSPVYEGMLKEEMDAAAARHPDVLYEPQLIDATFALLVASTGDPLVIPALNRDGDILSDLVLPLFGSIAGSESLLVAFEGEDLAPTALMAEAAHGTAPSLQGKNIANPLAMILAGAALLSQADGADYHRAGRAIREASLEAVAQGVKTADLGGHAGNVGVHRRGDPPDAEQARGLGRALAQSVVTSASSAPATFGSNCEPGAAIDLGQRRLTRHRRPVRTIGDHRVERVGHRDDPRLDRDRRARQAVRITVTVPALVVVQDAIHADAERPDAAQHLRAGHRVLADLDHLVRIERTALAQDLLADGELADVVQRPSHPDRLLHVLAGVERTNERQRELRHSGRMRGQSRVGRG